MTRSAYDHKRVRLLTPPGVGPVAEVGCLDLLWGTTLPLGDGGRDSVGERSSGQRGNAHGPPVAATAFKEIAVLPVHGGMLHARKQQPVAVETAVLRVVLK